MVIVSLRFRVPHERQKTILNAAKLVLGPTRIKPGCIDCRLYQDLDEPDALFLLEEWESRQKFERHINSEQYLIILSLMEASDQLPEIKINTISRTEGLEAIAAVRRSQ